MKKWSACILLFCCIMCISRITLATNFYDIKGTMYEGVVDRIASLGIVNGVSEHVFAANKGVTRAEIAKMIVCAKGLKEYADTYTLPISFKDTTTHWGKNYIQVAVDLGLLKGYEDKTFRPDKEVSYAETIAIVLRSLGYVNISETSGSTWYSNYVKRMYDIELNKGISTISSYNASAKRGDVAVLWWNMLISNRWAIESETDGSGLYYTYSKETQLEKLFPESNYVKGTIRSIKNGTSGDTIAVSIDGIWYNTTSSVSILSLGAVGSGVYDQKTKLLYGLSIDDDYAEYDVVSGPIFYLKEQGYKLNNAKTEYAYGGKSAATYAHLLVSKENRNVLRSLLVDASDSVIVNSVKVEYPNAKKSGDTSSGENRVGTVYLNGKNSSGDEFTTTKAVVIKDSQKVEWSKIPSGAVLTTLIKDQLYTYETKKFEGTITNYQKLLELYVDYDKYYVSDNCIYTIYGDRESGDKKTLKEYNYSSSMSKKKLAELMNRRITFYLNIAEEIEKIEFGTYLNENISEKYESSSYKLFYIQKISFPSDETKTAIIGNTFDGKYIRYEIKDNSNTSYKVGDLVSVELDAEGEIKNCQVITSSKVVAEDIRINYDVKASYANGAIGEYRVTDDTLIYKVTKKYANNRTDKIESCTLVKLSSVNDLEGLSKYRMILVCNEEMDIDVILAEQELNKVSYPVAKVVSMKLIKSSAESGDKNKTPVYNTELAVVGGPSITCKALSGDLSVGELVTFEGSGDKLITVKERFKPETLGYAKDLIVDEVNKRTKTATIHGTSRELDLEADKYVHDNTTYYLEEYKYLLTTVRKDAETGLWYFGNSKFYEREELDLKVGDRIAFNELNGIAVIYRGYFE